MKYLTTVATVVLSLAPACLADSIPLATVASELKADCPVPFRFGVAQDLASNLLYAQSQASYASPKSLELSIESVLRAIGIDGTAYVGWASTDPITWLQSTVAINPAATVGLSPSAINFGEVAVVAPTATPEPSQWLMLFAGVVVMLFVLWLARGVLKPIEPTEPAPPVLMTAWGPVTESARKQAVINMKADPGLRQRVFEVVLRECDGDAVKASLEFARRYPELGGVVVEFKS